MVVRDGLTIVNALRSFRQRAGLSQGELARQSGTTRQTIGALEAGSYAPTLVVALHIARALGCQVSDLFWLTPETPAARDNLSQRGARAKDGQYSQGLNTTDAMIAPNAQVVVVASGNGNGASHNGSHPGVGTEGGPTEQIEPQYRNQLQGTIAAIDRTELIAEVAADSSGPAS
jgi:DNA-binding XRE family transcriptional regulator